jgi:uncharacterized protein (TIGR03086 family)
MDPKELFAKAVDQVSPCVHRLEAEDLSNSTPCAEWDLQALLNHMVYELRWAPDVLRGKTIAEVGNIHDGDVLGRNPLQAWHHSVDAALVAIKQANPGIKVHLSYGDVPAGEYIAELARDMFIHGWDLGQALHCTLVFDKDITRAIFEGMEPKREQFVASSQFADPLIVADDADIQTKLLALYGRDSQWGASLA